MVLKREVVQRRIEELDRTLERLAPHRDVTLERFRGDLDLQWIVERGLLNAAGLVFDVADHILSGHFGQHAESYQASLDGLSEHDVIRPTLHGALQGLGGFRIFSFTSTSSSIRSRYIVIWGKLSTCFRGSRAKYSPGWILCQVRWARRARRAEN